MCEKCGWKGLINGLDVWIDVPDHEFALSTLEGTKNWVVNNEHCTERQKEAVENICGGKGNETS